MKRDLITHGAALLIGAMIVVVGAMTTEDLTAEKKLYCEMVELYDSTDGEYGWPDYRKEKESCV